jgi:hypothetical protein
LGNRNSLQSLGEIKRIHENLRNAEALTESLGDMSRLGQIYPE